MFSPVYTIFLICVRFFSVHATPLCPLVLSVDISNGTVLSNSSILFDNLVFPVESQFLYENSTRGCVCDIKPCIRKCCPKGKSFTDKGCEITPDVPSLTFHKFTEPMVNYTPDIYTIYNAECENNSEPVLLFPDQSPFHIQENGEMYMDGSNLSIVSQHEFCYEYFDFEDISGNISVVYCSIQTPTEESPVFLSIGMIISMPFLLATFIVYALLPERNIHGKCLMSYVITLFGAYVLLVAIQVNHQTIEYEVCRYAGLTCLYFFMVSFFWMNVMSIDIWWTFSGMRGRLGSNRKSERQKFLIYCAYSWGAPLLLVILVISLTLSQNIPFDAWYNPGMGEGQCWFKDKISTLIFFYLPMSIIIIANAVFFGITSYKIKLIRRDTSMLKKDECKKHSYENNKQMFNLYLKLLLAMGVNWIMEIISWAVKWKVENIPTEIWHLTDFFNAIYGVFIFFIFVFKKSIWKQLTQRYINFRAKSNLSGGMISMDYLSRTRGSTLNHTVTSDYTSYADDTSITPTSPVA